MEWEDGTSYSQYDKERKQRIWKLKGDHFSIYLINAHILDPENWVMQSDKFGIDNMSILPVKASLKKAKLKALEIIETKLDGFVEDFNEMDEFIRGEK